MKKNADELYLGNEKFLMNLILIKQVKIIEKINLSHPIISKFKAPKENVDIYNRARSYRV
jgi:hypothetical protein